MISETHSDHTLNGVRLAIAEEQTIDSQDVIVHFFGKAGDGDPVSIDLTERGRLSAWPEGFFDQIEADLGRLLRDGQAPAFYSDCYWVECRDGVELLQLLCDRATVVDPEACRLTVILLDRCQKWDNDAPVGCTPIDLPETPIPAFSASYALAMALGGRAVGCLVFPTCPRRGLLTLNGESDAAEVVFFAEASEAHRIWRHAFTLENVSEHEFFAVATFAFPSLIFRSDLRFGKLAGNYTSARDPVVRILGALNDHFPRVLAERLGLPYDVAAAWASTVWTYRRKARRRTPTRLSCANAT